MTNEEINEKHKNTHRVFHEWYRAKRVTEFQRWYNEEDTWKKLIQRLRVRRGRRIIRRVSTAAAVLLVGLLVIELQPTREKDTPVIAKSTETHQHGVILKMDNGNEVNLTRQKGFIETGNQNTRISNTKDELVYQVTDTGSIDTTKWNRLLVPRGSEYKLVLADGTKVWLNADSELHYPTRFGGIREVELHGEAYFEVAKDDAKSFIVRTENCEVSVLGTHFNVSAYNGEPVFTTLAEGSVQVNSGDQSVRLRPNEQAIVEKDDHSIHTREVEAARYIAWVNGRFVFRNTPLEDVVKQMERWYDVNIQFAADSLAAKRMAGVVYRNERLEFAIRTIERVTGVVFEQRPEGYLVKN